MICCSSVFEPDRISLPDIDVDFDDDGRGRVLNWVTENMVRKRWPISLLMAQWQQNWPSRMLPCTEVAVVGVRPFV